MEKAKTLQNSVMLHKARVWFNGDEGVPQPDIDAEKAHLNGKTYLGKSFYAIYIYIYK